MLAPGLFVWAQFVTVPQGASEAEAIVPTGQIRYRVRRNMRGKVVVQEESEYQAWLRKQKTFAQLSARAKQAKATQ
jgi:hypothetical protein